jgi:hypothetical protein
MAFFLNREIINDGVGVQRERSFQNVNVNLLANPPHDPRFFETLPTAWANGYSFQKAIEASNPTAIGEWLSLVCLHAAGVLRAVPYDQDRIDLMYDPDLWPALERTYPFTGPDKLTQIVLLLTNTGVTAGSYYPEIIYTPARNREEWRNDKGLQPYLSGSTLSWEKCRDLQLRDRQIRQLFLNRLLGILQHTSGRIRSSLENLCLTDAFFVELQRNGPEAVSKALETYIPIIKPSDPKDFLRAYPLKRTTIENGEAITTYYFVDGLPETAAWMQGPIGSALPHFTDFHISLNGLVSVQFGGEQHNLDLQPNERAVLLKDLFLANGSIWCRLPGQSNEAQAGTLRNFHIQAITNPGGRFAQLDDNDRAICLMPVKSEFLVHFPEMLSTPEAHAAVRHEPGTESLQWTFKLFGEERKIQLTVAPAPKDLTGAYLALWPPKVAQQWNLYVMHGKGDKTKHGQWTLVDEKGRTGTKVDLPADEYINILNRPDAFNRPMALQLNDSQGNERGLAFLNPLPSPQINAEPAELGIDFGTSNTCFAYKPKHGQAESLIFELSPKVLWGETQKLDNPGFVPLKWGGKRGFFPTILLSQKGFDFSPCTPAVIQAEHLFRVDIPGLHENLVQRWFEGSMPTGWDRHDNMKWELRTGYSPWRNLFLGLTMLYAQAEVFFRHGAIIENYVFTFPLAFSLKERENFHGEASQLTQQIRRICYGNQATNANYFYDVDESTAIALGIQSAGGSAFLEVFVDIGGGTTDLAIRHNNQILALDSFRVAGGAFFKFASENLNSQLGRSGGEKFIQHLGNLLFADELKNGNSKTDFSKSINQVLKENNLHLGTFYSLAINRLDDQLFKRREAAILEQRMGWPSFQLYRSQLFFRHIVAYALLQACAATVQQQLTSTTLTNGIKLILSGNGWGLMAFAEFERHAHAIERICRDILTTLKTHLLETCSAEERPYLEALKIHQVNLLNETALSVAKTTVAKGALSSERPAAQVPVGNPISIPDKGHRYRPFSGLTFRQCLVNEEEVELRWCDRWDEEVLREKCGINFFTLERLQINDQPHEWEKNTNRQLVSFTALGNMKNPTKDPLPAAEWVNINTRLCNSKHYLDQGRLAVSPMNFLLSEIFYSSQAAHLDLENLAKLNGTL